MPNPEFGFPDDARNTFARLNRIDRQYSPLRAYLLIRQAILRGELEPDEHLDERAMMRLTDHSRASVREGLRRLAANDVVTRRKRAGTRVGVSPTSFAVSPGAPLLSSEIQLQLLYEVDSIRPPLITGTFDESVMWSEREYLLIHHCRRVGTLFMYVPTAVREPLLCEPGLDGVSIPRTFGQRHGVPFGAVRTGVDSIRADEATSALLRFDVGTLLIVIDRSLTGVDGHVHEYGVFQLTSGRVRVEA